LEQRSDSVVLSDSTKVILQGLTALVEIRLYCPADASDLPDTIDAFAARIQRMLAEYVRVANGRIKVIQGDPQTDSVVNSAAGELGMVPFSKTSGRISYLGIAVNCGRRTEVMPQLAPEWEAALESDLSRAIRRVSTSPVSQGLPVAQTMESPTPIDPAVSEELLKMFPDLQSLSFDDAAKALRETALEEFKSAAIEMQSKVQIAQQKLAESREQNSGSDQQLALKEFQRVQSEQSDKLKQITARLQTRITVLERLKSVR
jgi:ABC-type uncharacterized transport system involved in gliding motility auxiliary subunit